MVIYVRDDDEFIQKGFENSNMTRCRHIKCMRIQESEAHITSQLNLEDNLICQKWMYLKIPISHSGARHIFYLSFKLYITTTLKLWKKYFMCTSTISLIIWYQFLSYETSSSNKFSSSFFPGIHLGINIKWKSWQEKWIILKEKRLNEEYTTSNNRF